MSVYILLEFVCLWHIIRINKRTLLAYYSIYYFLFIILIYYISIVIGNIISFNLNLQPNSLFYYFTSYSTYSFDSTYFY